MNEALLRKLRILGAIEGVSTLFLFGVAMPLKYVWALPLAVTIAGSVHGMLFMALVATNVMAITRVPIGTKLCVAGVFGAIIPFGPFVVDRSLKRLAQQER
jgi:integral membrane protein